VKARHREHLMRVRALACVLCDQLGMEQSAPTTAHHVRAGQGMSQRADHLLAVALCHDCHQGDDGIHGTRQRLRMAKLDELDLLALTLDRLL
jgi:hypothetical protein